MKKSLILFILYFALAPVTHAQVLTEKTQEPAESPESSPSSPPLETDDAGTPGPYGIEANVIGNCDYFEKGRTCGLGIDFNFGLGERTQLRIQKQTLSEAVSGESTFYGYDQTGVGIKYRFYDADGWKLALYPSYQFADETLHTNPDGTNADSEGRLLYLPLIISKQFGENTLIANIGYGSNLDYSDQKSVFTSFAIGRAFSETLRIMGELTSERTDLGRTTMVRVGATKEFQSQKTDYFDKAIFGSVGTSVGETEDQQTHTTALIGFTLATKPH